SSAGAPLDAGASSSADTPVDTVADSPVAAVADPSPDAAGRDPAPDAAGGDPAPDAAGGDPAPDAAGGDPAPDAAGGEPAPDAADRDSSRPPRNRTRRLVWIGAAAVIAVLGSIWLATRPGRDESAVDPTGSGRGATFVPDRPTLPGHSAGGVHLTGFVVD